MTYSYLHRFNIQDNCEQCGSEGDMKYVLIKYTNYVTERERQVSENGVYELSVKLLVVDEEKYLE